MLEKVKSLAKETNNFHAFNFLETNSVTYLYNFTGNRYQTTLHQRRYNQCWKWKPWRVPFYQGTLCNYVYISSMDHTTSKLKTLYGIPLLTNSSLKLILVVHHKQSVGQGNLMKAKFEKNSSFIAPWDEFSIHNLLMCPNKEGTVLVIWVSLASGSG